MNQYLLSATFTITVGWTVRLALDCRTQGCVRLLLICYLVCSILKQHISHNQVTPPIARFCAIDRYSLTHKCIGEKQDLILPKDGRCTTGPWWESKPFVRVYSSSQNMGRIVPDQCDGSRPVLIRASSTHVRTDFFIPTFSSDSQVAI